MHLPYNHGVSTGTVNTLRFSPDGQWVVSGSDDKTVCITVVDRGFVVVGGWGVGWISRRRHHTCVLQRWSSGTWQQGSSCILSTDTRCRMIDSSVFINASRFCVWIAEYLSKVFVHFYWTWMEIQPFLFVSRVLSLIWCSIQFFSSSPPPHRTGPQCKIFIWYHQPWPTALIYIYIYIYIYMLYPPANHCPFGWFIPCLDCFSTAKCWDLETFSELSSTTAMR